MNAAKDDARVVTPPGRCTILMGKDLRKRVPWAKKQDRDDRIPVLAVSVMERSSP